MADNEIKVHRRVIRVIFIMIQRAKSYRSVRRALPVHDNDRKLMNGQINDTKTYQNVDFSCLRQLVGLPSRSAINLFFVNGQQDSVGEYFFFFFFARRL